MRTTGLYLLLFVSFLYACAGKTDEARLVSLSKSSITLSNLPDDADTFSVQSSAKWKIEIVPLDARKWVSLDVTNGDTGLSTITVRTIAPNNSDTSQTAVIIAYPENQKSGSSIIHVSRNKYGISGSVTLGGTGMDVPSGIIPTTDGGYLCFGETDSNDGIVKSGLNGVRDGWIVKLDSAFKVEWERTVGGSGYDNFTAGIQTKNGYVLAGYTLSDDVEIRTHPDGTDLWVVEVDSKGTVVKQKAFGEGTGCFAYGIVAVQNGFIVAGSAGGIDAAGGFGFGDGWVLKLDNNLDTVWTRTLGGTQSDQFNCVVATNDGGCLLGGETLSDYSVLKNGGRADAWLVKMNKSGDVEWQKTFGESDYEKISGIASAVDGGYILAGESASDTGEFRNNHGEMDAWAVKVDDRGNLVWQTLAGGSSKDGARSVATWNGGYVITGYTSSDDVKGSSYRGSSDVWMVWMDRKGKIMSQQQFGGTESEFASAVATVRGKEFVVAARSLSYDGDLAPHEPGFELDQPQIWIFRLSAR